MADICQHMRWDYHTFINQPTWFIELIRAKKNVEAEFSQWQTKKSSK